MDGQLKETSQATPKKMITPYMLGLTAQKIQEQHVIRLEDPQLIEAVNYLAEVIKKGPDKQKDDLVSIVTGMDRKMEIRHSFDNYRNIKEAAKIMLIGKYGLAEFEAEKALNALELLFPEDQREE